jgi:hypothetical protein
MILDQIDIASVQQKFENEARSDSNKEPGAFLLLEL